MRYINSFALGFLITHLTEIRGGGQPRDWRWDENDGIVAGCQGEPGGGKHPTLSA